MTAPADDWQTIFNAYRRLSTMDRTRFGTFFGVEETAALGRIIAARDRGNPKQLLALGLTFVGSFALGIVCAGLIIGALCRL